MSVTEPPFSPQLFLLIVLFFLAIAVGALQFAAVILRAPHRSFARALVGATVGAIFYAFGSLLALFGLTVAFVCTSMAYASILGTRLPKGLAAAALQLLFVGALAAIFRFLGLFQLLQDVA